MRIKIDGTKYRYVGAIPPGVDQMDFDRKQATANRKGFVRDVHNEDLQSQAIVFQDNDYMLVIPAPTDIGVRVKHVVSVPVLRQRMAEVN
ncbi:MAG: hypothetical protein GY903_04605 [Fuerstiella sp.]|nr:hypothetical protein [Fuerstiella sp.]MCP4853756.1 hypothetical protein [Fuerstiella sp.]